jgi:arylsulfatase A-like enzyme
MRIVRLAGLAVVLSLTLVDVRGVAYRPIFNANARPNVLFVVFDDLNDWVGPLQGHPQAYTPAMDSVARRGVTFTNAHVQAPLCNPSRASFLTGLRPSTTGIYGLAPGIRAVPALAGRVTLPQHFAAHGYATASFGKIFHDGSIPPGQRQREFQGWGPSPPMPLPAQRLASPTGATGQVARLVDWGIFPDRDEDQADHQIASAAIAHLRAAPRDVPFFVAVGFRLPHVPNFASQRWFDRIPADRVQLPPLQPEDRADTPPFSWYLHWELPEPRLAWYRQHNELAPFVRAYLASTTFADAQLGRVLEALAAAGLRDNTIVVVTSDHGYHLGEKEITGKNSLWERSTRVPLLIAGRGIAPRVVSDPAELLDLYPTLAELARLPPRDDLEGRSLVPQLLRGERRTAPAITTHNQGNHAVRTDRWRYIRYADGSEELYDMRADPTEWTNLARDTAHRDAIAELRDWLPQTDAPPVEGSRNRVLTRDAEGRWLWEGKVIEPAREGR